jgi:hypothetical protein
MPRNSCKDHKFSNVFCMEFIKYSRLIGNKIVKLKNKLILEKNTLIFRDMITYDRSRLFVPVAFSLSTRNESSRKRREQINKTI